MGRSGMDSAVVVRTGMLLLLCNSLLLTAEEFWPDTLETGRLVIESNLGISEKGLVLGVSTEVLHSKQCCLRTVQKDLWHVLQHICTDNTIHCMMHGWVRSAALHMHSSG